LERVHYIARAIIADPTAGKTRIACFSMHNLVAYAEGVGVIVADKFANHRFAHALAGQRRATWLILILKPNEKPPARSLDLLGGAGNRSLIVGSFASGNGRGVDRHLTLVDEWCQIRMRRRLVFAIQES
jgi:hypothetical protein